VVVGAPEAPVDTRAGYCRHVQGVPWARALARRLLAESLPTRWAHTQGVGRAAEAVAHIVGDDSSLLICAAWLHDIGYSPEILTVGFHPLDGARYLRDIERADGRLCRLVANHTYSLVEARRRSLATMLTSEFPNEGGFLTDVLTYCDMTTSPNGASVDVDERLGEILTRYGESDVVAQSIQESRPEIMRSIKAVVAALS
jgi:hypothetical protein